MNKTILSVGQWKCLLFVMVLVTLGLNITATSVWEREVVPGKIGMLGFQFGLPDEEYRLPIVKLNSESALARAGARVGDTISFDDPGNNRRDMEAGEVIGLSWYQNNVRRHLFERVIPNPDTSDALFAYFCFKLFTVTCIALAILIGVRLSDRGVMRVLSSMLLFCAANVIGDQPAGAYATFIVQTWVPLDLLGAYLSLTYFSLVYPEGESVWRSSLVRRCFTLFAILYCLLTATTLAKNYMLLPVSWLQVLHPGIGKLLLSSVAAMWSIGAYALNWYRAKGLSKRRLAWVGLCMAGSYATFLVFNLDYLLGSPFDYFKIADYLLLIQTVSVCALAYALLRYRLFDFGFVVNRALAATIISTMLLVVFAVTEFGVDKMLHFEGREKNVIFDAAVALGIILCFHRIQHWVNHKVDHTFFRSWYEAAEELRRFLAKTSQVTASQALLEKYVEALAAFSGTAIVAIFLGREDGSMTCARTLDGQSLADLGANDNLLVDLRHRRQVIRLDGMQKDIPAELALPMITQGRLRGVVLLGAKADHEQYRPDELEKLGIAAQQLGTDLENLRALELEEQIRRTAQLETSLLSARQQIIAMEQACRAKDDAYHAIEREAAMLRQLLGEKATFSKA